MIYRSANPAIIGHNDTKSVNRFFIMNMLVEIMYTILQMLSGYRIVYKRCVLFELHL